MNKIRHRVEGWMGVFFVLATRHQEGGGVSTADNLANHRRVSTAEEADENAHGL